MTPLPPIPRSPCSWHDLASTLILAVALLLLVRSFGCEPSQTPPLTIGQATAEPAPTPSSTHTQGVARVPLPQVIPAANPRPDRTADATSRTPCAVTVLAGAIPIPGAVVIVATNDTSLDIRESDLHGIAAMQIPHSDSPLLLIATAPGYGPGRVPLPRIIPPEVEVTLPPQAHIVGRVSLTDGSVPPTPMRVLAWTTVRPPSPSIILGSPQSPTLLSTTTDLRGEFRFDAVSAVGTYSLAAGGEGWCTPDVTSGVSATTLPTVLTVYPFYAGLITFSATDGSALPPSDIWTIGYHAPDGFRLADNPSFDLALAGVPSAPPSLSMASPDWRQMLVAGYSHGGATDSVGLGLDCSVPGVTDTRVRIDLPRAAREIQLLMARLNHPNSQLGDIRLVYPAPPSTTDRSSGSSQSLSPHWLELHRAGDSKSYRLPLTRVTGESVVIRGVPCGTYRYRVYAANAGWVYPPEMDRFLEYTVRAGPNDMPIDTSQLGGLALLPTLLDTDRYSETLVITATRLEGRRREAEFVLLGPPYVIEGLPPGTYNVTIRAPSRGVPAGQPLVLERCVIEPGRVASRSFTLED